MSGTLPADRRASLRFMTQSVPGNGTFFFYCYYLRSMQTSAFLMGVVSVTTYRRRRDVPDFVQRTPRSPVFMVSSKHDERAKKHDDERPPCYQPVWEGSASLT